ncbi:MAG: hypothetical protein AB2L14_25460 [Candidatus Xenobiia bacterium LiM19]
MATALRNICSSCGEPFSASDTADKMCFYCSMEAAELANLEPGDFDEWIAKTLDPPELDAWQRYNAQMGYTVPHFRSVRVGNKTEAHKVTERCPDCGESCLSIEGCPYR